MRTYDVVSADSHLEVSPEWWRPYVDTEYRRFAPRVVKLDNGGDAWEMPATGRIVPLGLNFFATSSDPRTRFKSARYTGVSYSEGLLGAGDAEQRLQEQDMDGIDAEALYPAVAGQRSLEGLPDEAYVAIVRGYNDWLGTEFCRADPDRLFGLALLPPTSLGDAIDELRRVAEMSNIRGVTLHAWPNGSGAPAPEDDEFWHLAVELGVPLSAHGNFGAGLAEDPRRDLLNGGAFNKALVLGFPPAYTQAQLISEGVLDRVPRLRLYFAETGIQWVPGFMECADDMYERHRWWAGVDLAHPPSWYVREHFLWGFQKSPSGLASREHIGVENILWASDFPHMATDFPDSRQLVKEQIEESGLSGDEVAKIYRDNCLRFFHIDAVAG